MYSLLLAIIYIAFISLGLPDSLLGSAWPTMYGQLGVPVSFAGGITMIISFGTIVSSLLSDTLTRKLGAGLVTAISVLATAVALFGFSLSNSFLALCLWAIPYGLGAGAVDAALNNYVALHYSSRHMSWLHCFWGVGTAISPYIMSYCLTGGLGWHRGYSFVSLLQVILAAVLFLSLPLWKKRDGNPDGGTETQPPRSLPQILKIRGIKYMLLAFFGYSALESTAGLWASSYLAEFRGISSDTAARFASLFYLGITFGRFLCGFISDRIGDKNMIRSGILVSAFGVILVAFPLDNAFALIGLIVIGFGCAPVYPSIIHSTPANFGKENSQAAIGVQMASAYTGTTLMPPLFGLLGEHISMGLYPFYLLFFALLMLVVSEGMNRLLAKPKVSKN